LPIPFLGAFNKVSCEEKFITCAYPTTATSVKPTHCIQQYEKCKDWIFGPKRKSVPADRGILKCVEGNISPEGDAEWTRIVNPALKKYVSSKGRISADKLIDMLPRTSPARKRIRDVIEGCYSYGSSE
jgi:hypothetical protein